MSLGQGQAIRDHLGLLGRFAVAFAFSSFAVFGVAGAVGVAASRALTQAGELAIVAIVLAVALALDAYSLRRKTWCPVTLRRQTPKTVLYDFGPRRAAVAWGLDTGLVFTTYRMSLHQLGAACPRRAGRRTLVDGPGLCGGIPHPTGHWMLARADVVRRLGDNESLLASHGPPRRGQGDVRHRAGDHLDRRRDSGGIAWAVTRQELRPATISTSPDTYTVTRPPVPGGDVTAAAGSGRVHDGISPGGAGAEREPELPQEGNTRPTQLVPRGKINTKTTRTRRHFPARAGTTAKMPV